MIGICGCDNWYKKYKTRITDLFGELLIEEVKVDMQHGRYIDINKYDFLVVDENCEKEIEAINALDIHKCIPIEFLKMQLFHHMKLNYINRWKKMVERHNIRVLSNWTEFDECQSCVIQIDNAFGGELSFSILSLQMDSTISIEDIRSGTLLYRDTLVRYSKNSIYLEGGNSDSLILRITVSGINIPYIFGEIINKTVDLGGLDEKIRRNFIDQTLSLGLGFHEDDYRLIAELKDRKGVIVDCGVNYCQSALTFLNHTTKCKIIGLEANPIFRSLHCKLTSIYDRLMIYPYGCASDEGEMVFYDSEKNPQISGSFIKDDIIRRLNFYNLSLEVRETKVRVTTIDKILEKNNERVQFIKLDVEGFEYNAIQGAKKTIEKYKPIILLEKHDDKILQVMDDMFSGKYVIRYYDPYSKKLVDKNVYDSINFFMIPLEGEWSKLL